MSIQVGDKLPSATLVEMSADGPVEVEFSDVIAGKKVAFFGLPGAYTGVCTTAHLPSFINAKAAFDAKGVDEVICISVNDPFVLAAWSKETGAGDAGIRMLGDAGGELVSKLGLTFDAPAVGLRNRSLRFAAFAQDGELKTLQVEESPGACTVSAGDALLEAI